MSDSTSSLLRSISILWWFTRVSVKRNALLLGNIAIVAMPFGLMNGIKVSLKVSISIYFSS